MDRRTLLVGAAGLGPALAATRAIANGAPRPAYSFPDRRNPDAAHLAALDRLAAYVEEHRREYGLPGMTVSIVADGFSAVISSGYADMERQIPFAPEHVVQIGSISKSMTALSTLRLVQAGRLRLDQDVRELLPDVPWPTERITLTNLLDHSSGLPDDAPVFPRGVDRLWVGFKPGSSWSYSNTGYQLLGLILERIEGRSVEAILREQVLGPLGMTETLSAIRAEDRPRYAIGYSPYYTDLPAPMPGKLGRAAWVDMTEASGCVASTSRAMARYIRFIIDAGQGHGGALLDPERAKLFTQPWIDAPGWSGGGRYGAGLATVMIDGRPHLHHTGGMISFNSSITVDPVAGVGAYASTNVGMIDYRPREVTAYACALLRAMHDGQEAAPPPPVRKPVTATAPYLGQFQAADGEAFEVAEGPGGLKLRYASGEAELEQTGDGQFLAHAPRFARFALVFERDGPGVRGVWWGPQFFAHPGAGFPPAPHPELLRFAGRYDNDSPWLGTMRIVARPSGLWLNGTQRLVPADGAYRVDTDPNGPERIRFDALIDGRPQRLNFSGVDFLRRTEPV